MEYEYVQRDCLILSLFLINNTVGIFFAHLKLLLCRILIYLTFVPTHRNAEYKVGMVALFSQPSSAHKGLRIHSLDSVQKLSE